MLLATKQYPVITYSLISNVEVVLQIFEHLVNIARQKYSADRLLAETVIGDYEFVAGISTDLPDRLFHRLAAKYQFALTPGQPHLYVGGIDRSRDFVVRANRELLRDLPPTLFRASNLPRTLSA
jgi:hypothetical protein